MVPVSNRERKNIIDAKERGESIENIIKWYGVCKTTIYNVYNQYKKTGSYEPLPFPGKISSIFDENVNEKILKKVKETPDITQEELIEELGLDVTQSGMSRHMKKLGLSLKKRLSMQLDYKNQKLLKEEQNLKKSKKP